MTTRGIDEEDLHLFVMQRREIEELEARLKIVKAEHQIVTEAIFDKIHELGLKSYPHELLGRFVPRSEIHVGLARPELNEIGEVENEDARQQLEAWSKEEKDEAGHALFDVLFYWAVKSARLKQVVKERLEENLDPPPGVTFYHRKAITFTPPKQLK